MEEGTIPSLRISGKEPGPTERISHQLYTHRENLKLHFVHYKQSRRKNRFLHRLQLYDLTPCKMEGSGGKNGAVESFITDLV